MGWRRRTRWGVLFGVWLVTLATMGPWARAQLRLEPPASPPPARPGDFLTLAFVLHNDGAETLRVVFRLEAAVGFSALGLSPVELGPAAEETVFVTVVVGPSVPAGKHVLTLVASADGLSASAELALVVEALPGLELQGPAEANWDGKIPLRLSYLMINRGNAPDTVALAVETARAVEVELSATIVELLPGETRTVEVVLRPVEGFRDERLRLILRANSTRFPEVAARVTTLIRLLPPLPEEVGGRLLLEVPSTLALQATFSSNPERPVILTYGLEGAADFAEADRLAYRLTFDNLSVREMRFALERGIVQAELGLLALDWTSLISLAGAGARLGVRGLPGQGRLALAALSQALQPRLGAQLGWSWAGLETTLSQALRVEPEGTTSLSALSLRTRWESLVLESEWALSVQGAEREGGVLARASLEEPLGLRLEVLRTGGAFAGERPNTTGFSIDQRWSSERWAWNAFFARTQETLDPSRRRVAWSSDLRWSLDAQEALAFALDYEGTPADVEARSRLETTWRWSRAFRETITLAGALSRLVLATSADTRETWALTGEGAFSDARTFALLRATLSFERSLFGGPIRPELETLASVQLQADQVQLALTGSGTSTGFGLRAGLTGELAPWALSAALELDRFADGGVSAEGRLAAQVDFDAPIGFLPIRGRIAGTAFVDLNGNGTRDAEEPPVADLVIVAAGRKVRTDPQGNFRTFPLAPGTVELALENLPATLLPLPPLTLEVRAGEESRVQLPLRPAAELRGVVFEDRNQNGRREPEEPPLAQVRVRLEREGRTQVFLTGTDGTFRFGRLAAGPARVVLETDSLPPRFRPTTPTALTLELVAGEVTEVTFGVFQEPQRIVFVPTADFTFSPEAPRAGEPVTFDGSLSFDPDGTIVAYAWDFDGDGQADATGPRITWTFAAPGSFAVTLTVTDNEGNVDSLTKTVEVR